MTRNRGKILMACANYWGSPLHVGSHHLARGFVRDGWEVAFVSDPISPLHRLAGPSPGLRERRGLHRAGGCRDLDGRLWAYVPCAVATPHSRAMLRGRWVMRHWHDMTRPNVAAEAARHGFGHVDLLYIDSATQAFWLDHLDFDKSVYRVTDDIRGFPKYTPAMEEAERRIVAAVDAVAVTSEGLRPRMEAMGARRLLSLPNGVDVEHFSGGTGEPPPEYAGLPRPIVIYVGAIDVWFDFELVRRAAAQCPQFSFVLIGPDHLARKHLAGAGNIHVLGTRPYARIPQYLRNADVGIIPFDVARHGKLVNSIHPLKLYEYMACGLPVVSVEWAELKRLDSPAVLCGSGEELIAAIQRCASQTPNREAGARFAAAHAWQRRVTALIESLDLRT